MRLDYFPRSKCLFTEVLMQWGPFNYLSLDLRGKVTFQSLARHTVTELRYAVAMRLCAENSSALMWNHHNVPLLGSNPGFRGIQRLFITESWPCGIVLGNRKTCALDSTDKSLVRGISWQILFSESLNLPHFFSARQCYLALFKLFLHRAPILQQGRQSRRNLVVIGAKTLFPYRRCNWKEVCFQRAVWGSSYWPWCQWWVEESMLGPPSHCIATPSQSCANCSK